MFFSSQDKSVSVRSDKFSVLLREYWQLGFNVLTSSPETLDWTENDFL